MATWNSLIAASLRKVGRLESGGTPTTSEYADGLEEVNRILQELSIAIGPIYFETTDSVTWTGGQASRTIGTSGNFNVSRPIQLLAAQYRDSGGTDLDLITITHREYQSISEKSLAGSPDRIAYNPTFASSLGTLFIWPVPSSDTTVRLTSKKPFTAAAAGTDDAALPPGCEPYITFELGARLGSEFGADLSAIQICQQKANNAYKMLVEANVDLPPMQMDPLMPGANCGVELINE